MPKQQTYQISTGVPRHVYGARDRITREAHALAVRATEGDTAKGTTTALWATDLRRGRLNIYGGLLRFIDHLHRRGIPMETALLIPRWLEEYVRELWSDAPEQAVVKVKRAA